MFLYILLSNCFNVYYFSCINFICESKSIIWLSYNDSKSVYIFLEHPASFNWRKAVATLLNFLHHTSNVWNGIFGSDKYEKRKIAGSDFIERGSRH